ncbi:MAG: Gfo/Idh/MocA family oxidoreductase [Bacteroidota bacterium]
MGTRRHFVKTGALYLSTLGLPQVLSGELLAAMRKKVSPNDHIQLGVIGCNGMGFSNLVSLLKNSEVQIVALCDVDEQVLAKRTEDLQKANIKKPKWYMDYRKMLADKDVDIVVIGTPDHWHCLQLIDAVDAGKDVYCEKPIANSIYECEAMLQAVNASDRIVQVGQWQRSQPHFVDAIHFVHSGKLGQIRLVKAWAYQGWMPPVPVVGDSDVPVGVDYDLWLGPAQKRPFNKNRFHFNFRWFWDYAGGLMTDWGVHLMDYALYGMQAELPKSVMAIGGKFAYPDDASETPDTLQTVYEFEDYSILWEHATGIDGGNYGRDHGIAFIGNNGTLVLNRGGWEVIPENDRPNWDQNLGPKMEAVPLQTNSGRGLDMHTTNFLSAVKARDAQLLNAPISVGYTTALVCHMGNVAFKTGERIYWDKEKQQFDNAQSNQLLKPQYHNGWNLPAL